MNNKYLIIAIGIATSLVLGGCGTNKGVTLNPDKGQVTIKTDEGEVKYNGGNNVKMPESFPKELMAGENTKVIMTATTDKGITLAYSTTSKKEDVFSKLSELSKNGWKKEVELNTGDGMMLSFSKEKMKCLITIGEETSDKEKLTQVSIVLDKE